MDQCIVLKNKPYFYYATYPTWKQAIETAHYYQRLKKCRYYILKVETHELLELMPEIKYRLYLSKSLKIW